MDAAAPLASSHLTADSVALKKPSRTQRKTGIYVDPETFSTLSGAFPLEPEAVQKRSLQSYIWSNNSCFIDVTLEVFFRSFVLWSPDVRHHFVKNVLGTELKNSPVLFCKVYYHYHNRIRWILARSLDETPSSTFALTQAAVRDVVHKRWDILVTQYGCTLEWWLRMLKVKLLYIFAELKCMLLT